VGAAQTTSHSAEFMFKIAKNDYKSKKRLKSQCLCGSSCSHFLNKNDYKMTTKMGGARKPFVYAGLQE